MSGFKSLYHLIELEGKDIDVEFTGMYQAIKDDRHDMDYPTINTNENNIATTVTVAEQLL